jgi:hypothetical protein
VEKVLPLKKIYLVLLYQTVLKGDGYGKKVLVQVGTRFGWVSVAQVIESCIVS